MLPNPEFPTAFEPEAFFAKPTRGVGAIYSVLGGLHRRCAVETDGRWDAAYGALHFDERYRFDNRNEDVMHWAVSREGGTLSAYEVSVVGPLTSVLIGPTWRVRFQRRGAPPLKFATLTYDAVLTLVTASTVFKQVKVSWRGLPLGVLRCFHQQVE
jgi:hypothetical protein